MNNYTRFRDANDEKIYEGDVLTDEREYCQECGHQLENEDEKEYKVLFDEKYGGYVIKKEKSTIVLNSDTCKLYVRK